MASRIVSRLVGLVLAATMVGCTCSDSISTPREVDPLTKAQLRVVVCSPDAPDLRVTQNDRSFGAVVTRADTAAPYDELPSGIRNLRFIGTTSAIAYHSVNVDLGADRRSTYVLFDSTARMRGVLARDEVPTAVPGTIHLRLIHMADGIGSMTILADDVPVSSPVTYPTADGYVAASASAAITLRVREGMDERTIPVVLGTVRSGRTYTLIVDRVDAALRVRPLSDR